jgi:hypothetical protein
MAQFEQDGLHRDDSYCGSYQGIALAMPPKKANASGFSRRRFAAQRLKPKCILADVACLKGMP